MNFSDELNAAWRRMVQSDLDDRAAAGERGIYKGPRSIYRYFDCGDGRHFCYTIRPDTQGNYYAFEYVPKGRGKARTWYRKNEVRFARRNKAKARAIARAQKWQAKITARKAA